MDRNTFTGLFLMLIIIVGSVFLMRPSEEEIKREKLLQDSIALSKTAGNANSGAVNTANTADTAATGQPVQDSVVASGPFGSAKNGTAAITTIENEHIKVNISNKGGRIESVELKNQKDYLGNPLIMFEGDNNTFGLQFSSAGENVNTNDLYFNSSSTGFSVSEGDSSSV